MTVQRDVKTSDGMGGWTSKWSSLYTLAPCRLQPMSGEEQTVYDKRGVPSTHKLFCDNLYSFTEDDKVVVSSKTYEVVLVRDIDLMSHHQEVNLRRIKPNL